VAYVVRFTHFTRIEQCFLSLQFNETILHESVNGQRFFKHLCCCARPFPSLLISERDRTKKEKGTAMVRQVKSQHFLKHSKIFFMLTLSRKLLLDSLIKQKTLTFTDIGKEHNLGLVPNEHRLQILLDELENDSSIKRLDVW
jgi:hypothetical protein